MKPSTSFTFSPMASAALLVTLLALPTTSALTLHNRKAPSISPAALFSRDDSTCGDSSYLQCTNAGLPSDFCCPSDQSCVALAGNTTALCCPKGSDCSEIEPIPCDLSLEDKSQHPENVVMTTALTGTLEQCGTKCCPFGYSCNGDGNCYMNEDQSTKPSTSSGSSTASATSTAATSTSGTPASTTTAPSTIIPATSDAQGTATSSSGASSAATASSGGDATSSSSPAASPSAGAPNAGAVAGGIVGGIAGAVIVGMLLWFCIKKEMKRKEATKNKDPNNINNEKAYPNAGSRDSRSSSFGNILNNPVTRGNSGRSPRGAISKPILSEEQAAAMMRSDFGRKVSPHESDFPQGPDDYEGYYGRGLATDKDEEDGRGGRPRASSISSSTCSLDADLEHDIHEVLRSPPKIETPRRPVDSMYAAYDYLNDPTSSGGRSPGGTSARESHYPDPSSPSHNNLRDTRINNNSLYHHAPLKMPSACLFGGDDARVSVAGVAEGRPLSGYGGQRVTRDPGAGYIDVFADSNALLAPPPPLPRMGGKGANRGQAGDRLTDFGDFIPEGTTTNNTTTTFGQGARK